MVTPPGGRLDQIQKPNLAGYARDWMEVVPDDSPPLDGSIGNTGSGCFALYIGTAGFVRFLTRGGQTEAFSSTRHLVNWVAPMSQVFLEIGGVRHPVVWLQAVPKSVRVWAPEGTYLNGEIVHVFGHDTTVPLGRIHSLRV